jgi:hypothetical protein
MHCFIVFDSEYERPGLSILSGPHTGSHELTSRYRPVDCGQPDPSASSQYTDARLRGATLWLVSKIWWVGLQAPR